MATFGDVLDRVFRHAKQGGAVDLLGAALLTGSQGAVVTITATDASKWGAPAICEIESEQFYITSFDRSSKQATAVRGWADTTPAAHSANAICRINPRFTRQDARDAVIEGVRKMCPPLYQMTATNVTYLTSTTGYTLPASTLDVYRISARTDTSTNNWRELYSFNVVHNQDTSIFTNGIGLILREAGSPNLPLRVEYKKAFTDPSLEADDMSTTVGLETFMLDLPVWYAVSVLLGPEEISRGGVDAAVVSQRAETNAQGSALRTAEYYRARFENGIKDAAEQLQMKYPPRPRISR